MSHESPQMARPPQLTNHDGTHSPVRSSDKSYREHIPTG